MKYDFTNMDNITIICDDKANYTDYSNSVSFYSYLPKSMITIGNDYRNQSCNTSTQTLIDNVCYTTPTADDGSFYFNAQFETYDINFVLDVNVDEPLDDYLISFWFKPEQYSNFRNRLSNEDYNKFIILETNTFRLFVVTSDTDRVLLKPTSVNFEMKGNDTNKSDLGLFKENDWNIIRIATDNTNSAVDVYLNNVKTTFTKTGGKTYQTELTNVMFRQQCEAGYSWYAGYYKHLEILNSDYITYNQYLEMKNYIDINSFNKFKPEYLYPAIFNTINYYPFSIRSAFPNDAPITYTNTHLLYDSVHSLDKILLGFDEVTLTNINTTPITYNTRLFNYEINPKFYSHTCPTNCSKCVSETFCIKCATDYLLVNGVCELHAGMKYYYLSPLEDQLTELSINFDNNTNYQEATFLIYFKTLGLLNQDSVFFKLGQFHFKYKRSDNIFYVLNSVTDVTLFRAEISFDDVLFNKWNYISFSYFNNYQPYVSDSGNGSASNSNPMIRFSFNKDLQKLVTGQEEETTWVNIQNVNVSTFSISNEFVGLITNFKYSRKFYNYPDIINIYDINDDSDIKSLDFNSDSNDGTCIEFVANDLTKEVNSNIALNHYCIQDVGPTIPTLACEDEIVVNGTTTTTIVKVKALNTTNSQYECVSKYYTCRYDSSLLSAEDQAKYSADYYCNCFGNQNDYVIYPAINNVDPDPKLYYCFLNTRSVNLLAYTPITFPTSNSSINEANLINDYDFPIRRNVYTYTFEAWLLLKANNKNGMTGIEFQWSNHLKISIDLERESNKFIVGCYPSYINNTAYVNYNKKEVEINRGTYIPQLDSGNNPIEIKPEWTHYRCSVDLPNRKFLVSTIHDQVTNSSNENNTPNTIEANIESCTATSNTSLCHETNLFSDNYFKLISNNQKMISSGRIFIRQLRLWDCYYCDYPGNSFRANINDSALLKRMFSSRLLRVWDTVLNDFTNDYSNGMKLKEYVNNNYTSVSFDASLVENKNYYRLAYENRDDSYLIDEKFLVKLSEYYTKRFLPNLDDFPNDFVSADSFKAPLDGRATLDFFMKVGTVANFSQGANFILTDTMTIHIHPVVTGTSGVYDISAYCFVDEYKDQAADTLADNIESKYCSSENRIKNSFSNISDGTWFNVRCAFDQVQDTYYLSYNNSVHTSNNYVTPLMYRTYDENSQTQTTVRNNQPFRRILSYDATTNLKIKYVKSDLPKLYIRNINYYNTYIPFGVDYRYYDLYGLDYSDIPSRAFAIDFSRHNMLRNWIETKINNQASTNQQFNVNKYDYANEIIPMCPTGSTYSEDNTTLTCNFFDVSLCINGMKNCKEPGVALTCKAQYFLTSANQCSSTCKLDTTSANYELVRNPLSEYNTFGEFCSYTCDGESLGNDTSFSMNSCKSNTKEDPNTKYITKITNYTCDSSNRFNDLFRFNYKCYPEKDASKGRLYFNSCYDFDNVVADVDNTSEAVSTYSFGFWFKYDLVNMDCDWNSSTFTDIINKHLFYSNNHKLSVPEDKTTLVYKLLDISESEQIIKGINPYSWNQLTFYIENTSITYDTRVFVNYKDKTTLIPFPINSQDQISISKQLMPIGSTSLNLKKIGFCHRANCLAEGDNVRMSAAFYKDVFYHKGIIPFNFIFDNTRINFFMFPMNIKNSDLNFIESGVGKNLYYINNNLSTNRIIFFYSSTNKDLNLQHKTNINYSTVFDWEEENKGNVITSTTAQSLYNYKEAHQCSATSGNIDYFLQYEACPEGCARCFANGICYECFTPDTDPTGQERIYFFSKGTCVAGQKIRYTLIPPKHLPTAQNYRDYLKMPLNLPDKQKLIDTGSTSTEDFYKLNEFTISIFINYKSYFFGECSSNTLIKFHKDLILCYNESDDSLKLVNSQGIAYMSYSNFLVSNFAEWKFVSLSINLNTTISHDKGIMSFSVGRSEDYTDGENILTPPSLDIKDYFFSIYYKYEALLYNFNVYKYFVLNPFGLLRSNKNQSTKLLTHLNLYTSSIRSSFTNNEDKNPCLTWDSITYKTEEKSYYDDFYCEYENGYNDYLITSTCSYTNTIMCGSCHPNCYGSCVNTSSSGCTCDDYVGQYFLSRDNTISSATDTKFKTTCERLDYFEFSRYKENNVTYISLSDGEEYAMDFWMYVNFYSLDLEYDLFNAFSLVWDYHMKLTVQNDKTTTIVVTNQDAINADPSVSPVYANTTESTLNFYCHPQYVPTVFNTTDNTVISEMPSYSNNNFKASNEISVGKWVHLQCSANIKEKKAYGNSTEIYSLTNNGYDFAESKLNTTLFRYTTTSKPNYGILMFKNINLWNSDMIGKILANKCIFTPLSLFPELLHSFNAKYNANNLGFSKANVNSTTTLTTQEDYEGYGAFTDIMYQNSIDNYDTCLNLVVSPLIGINTVTEFTISCNRNDIIASDTNKFIVYFLNPLDSTNYIYMTENVEDPTKFSYTFNVFQSSTNTNPDSFSNIEIICQNQYYDESTGNTENEYVYDTIKLNYVIKTEPTKEEAIGITDGVIKEEIKTQTKLTESIEQIKNAVDYQVDNVISVTINSKGEKVEKLEDSSVRIKEYTGVTTLENETEYTIKYPGQYTVVKDKTTNAVKITVVPGRLSKPIIKSSTVYSEVKGECSVATNEGVIIFNSGCSISCPSGSYNYKGKCYKLSQRNSIIKSISYVTTAFKDIYSASEGSLKNRLEIAITDIDTKIDTTADTTNVTRLLQEKIRNLQDTTTYLSTLDNDGLASLHSLIELAISADISVETMNNSYLSIINEMLSSSNSNMITLINNNYEIMINLIELMYDFYYSSLQKAKYYAFVNYLHTTDKNENTFDVKFYSLRTDSFNQTEVYSKISTLQDSTQYGDNTYVIDLIFDDALQNQFDTFDFSTLVDFSIYNAFFNTLEGNLQTIQTIMINNYVESEIKPLNYTYPGIGMFVFKTIEVNENFDFSELNGLYPYRSYFDASALIKANPGTYYITYILFLDDIKNLQNPDKTKLDCLYFKIYDSSRKELTSFSTPVQVYLTFGKNSIIAKYAMQYPTKYSTEYDAQKQNYTDIIQQPYYVDDDGKIYHDYTKEQRIEDFHKKYNITIQGNEAILDSNYYLDGTVDSPPTDSVCGMAVENEENYITYENEHFWKELKILIYKDNIKENETFFVLVVCTGFLVLLTFILMCFKPRRDDTNAISNSIRNEFNNRFSKLAFMFYKSNSVYSKARQFGDSNLKIEQSEIGVLDSKIESFSDLDNMSFCTAFQNLLSTNRFSCFFSPNSTVEPKYKQIFHFTIYFVLNILFLSLYLTFNSVNYLDGEDSEVYKKTISYAIAAIVTSNTAMIIIILINRVSSAASNAINIDLISGKISEELDSVDKKNKKKFVVTFILFLGIFAATYISSVGFSAYWANYKGLIAVCIPLMLILDFIIFDVLYSMLLAGIHTCGITILFNILNAYKFTRAL